tara:strand:- start:18345 stop:18776 length:432 start_codon:yes stop_codon:yes gene_type:complete
MIYLAYGSNLNKEQMKFRCPKAKPRGFIMLPDYKMIFRGVADMIPLKGHYCPVGIWDITKDCEIALDRYEGFPHLYRKEYFINNETDEIMMAYVMNTNDFSMPSKLYYSIIEKGYEDFNIPKNSLFDSLNWTNEREQEISYSA